MFNGVQVASSPGFPWRTGSCARAEGRLTTGVCLPPAQSEDPTTTVTFNIGKRQVRNALPGLAAFGGGGMTPVGRGRHSGLLVLSSLGTSQ